ncbi:MAG: hypothetical protein ACXAC2_15755 [Candidatus Kariarchaeaceae archaeon]
MIIINNDSDDSKNLTISVIDSDSIEVFNFSFASESGHRKSLRNITNKEGIYSIYILINGNLSIHDNEINVGKDYGPVKLRIYNEEVRLWQDQN